MIRKTITLVFVAALLASCGNKGTKESAAKDNETASIAKVDFQSLIDDPDSYIGKEISIEGKVVHVCMHSGKKMYITGENPDIRLFITAGENSPKFPMELLGSEIVVEGTLTTTQVAESPDGEAIITTSKPSDMNEGAACETEKALASQPALAELMMVYNKHTLVK